AWLNAGETIKENSKDTIERWNKGIDNYLLFAALFSAVVTEFNLKAYGLLDPPPPDPSLAAVQQVSLQLSTLSIHPPFINSTYPAWQEATISVPPIPSVAIIWLNIFWFSSLILSLSSALICILVKQWLVEHNSGITNGTACEIARRRMYRYNNLLKWRVDDIVSLIPLLLLLALGVFLAGLLILIWTVHHAWAIGTVASALTLLLTLFTFVTTLLPTLRVDCPYLSPQALLLDAAAHSVRYGFNRVRRDSTSHGVKYVSWDCRIHLILTSTFIDHRSPP
ncbi:hypothetical protein OH77DRAFT_1548358, partial [Trametes cingulata]